MNGYGFLRKIRKFLNIGQVLQQDSLDQDRIKAGKSKYISEDKLTEFEQARANLSQVKRNQVQTARKIEELNTKLDTLATKILKQAEKEGITTPKNFSLVSAGDKIIKLTALFSAIAAGFMLISVVLKNLITSYKDTQQDKEFNEKLYEKLLNEEYEERKYIIGLLEDMDREKEIEASQSVINLPSVEAVRVAQPAVVAMPPPPAPSSMYGTPAQMDHGPESSAIEPEPVSTPISAPELSNPAVESIELVPSEELTPPKPVSMYEPVPVETASEPIVEEVTSTPIVEETPVVVEEPKIDINNDSVVPPKMSFSRMNASRLFDSSLTKTALKALGLEKPAEILGTTVVTTIIIHYVDKAINDIENLLNDRMGSTGAK